MVPLWGIVDVAFSILVISTAVVAWWRGTWQILDAYDTSPWGSIPFGVGATILMVYGQVQMGVHRAVSTKVKWAVAERLVTCILGWATLCVWRGIWYLLDVLLLEPDKAGLTLEQAAWLTHAGGLAILGAARVLRSALAAPALILHDDAANGFVFDSWALGQALRRGESERIMRLSTAASGDSAPPHTTSWAASAIDQLFVVAVIGTGVAGFWRGTWNILDAYIFPAQDARVWSSLACLIGASALGCVMAAIPFHSYAIWKINTRLERAVLERCFTYVQAWIAVAFWRGTWLLLDYLLLERARLSLSAAAWASHLAGGGTLLVTCCFRSVVAAPLGPLYDDTWTGFQLMTFGGAMEARAASKLLDTPEDLRCSRQGRAPGGRLELQRQQAQRHISLDGLDVPESPTSAPPAAVASIA
ncbi:unnamed protein product [Chrysoparadoxa australica]